MANCEMCGKTISDPKTVKVEGAELEVCNDCADFGTEVRQQSSSSTSSKYSTSSSASSSSSSSKSSGGGGGGGGGGGSNRRRSDMFDEMEEVATDYDERIRTARESRDLSQEELANQLNEKASLIRKIERGDVLPSDSVQRKLEKKLDISLSAGDDVETEWEGGSSTGSTTLGDVVERKD